MTLICQGRSAKYTLPPFGTASFVHVESSARKKTSLQTAKKGVFVGVNMNNNTILVYYPDSATTVSSSHVRFAEKIEGGEGGNVPSTVPSTLIDLFPVALAPDPPMVQHPPPVLPIGEGMLAPPVAGTPPPPVGYVAGQAPPPLIPHHPQGPGLIDMHAGF